MNTNKKIVLVLLFLSFTFSIETRASISLLDERGDEIKLKFEAPHYSIGSQAIHGETCATIEVNSEPSTYEKGYPEVPFITQSVLISNDKNVTLEILSVKYTTISLSKIVPSRGLILRSENPDNIPYSFGSIYTQDTWYPENSATLSEPFIFRDVRGVTVTFNPFQYNAARQTLRIAQEMVVVIKANGTARTNILSADPVITSTAFSNIYEKMFLNYTQHRYQNALNDGDKMIIIAADKYKADLEPFVKWKNQKGIKTTVYSYPSESGTGATGVKDFIKKKFTDEKISYVLLVGSASDIPGGGTSTNQGDNPYTLVGTGIYPAVHIGRFCVSSSDQLKTIINKSINYEKKPDINGSWYGNALCNGSKDDGGTGNADWKWMKEFADSLKKGGYAKADVYSEGGAGSLTAGTAATTSAAINGGISWFNYMGHGSQTAQSAPSFSSSNINSLTNKDKYPVCISVACYNGQYSTTCIGQSWTCAGTPTEGKGGIVYLGSFISQAWVPPQYAMQGMMSVIAQQGNFVSVGNIVMNGLVIFLNKYKKDESNIFATWVYFGDPSIYLTFKKPEPIKLTHPTGLSTGSRTFEVSGPDNVTACVYSKSQDIWQSKQITGGKASFSIDIKNTTDTIFITGVGKNKAPYIGTLNLGPTNISDNSVQTLSKHMSILYNQAFHTVTFKYPQQYSEVAISIYRIDGSLVYEKNIIANSSNSFTWQFTTPHGITIAKGMYYVSMKATMNSGVVLSTNKTLMHF